MKIMTNVTIYSMAANDDAMATAIAWEGDRIVAVGDEKDLLRQVGDSERIDGLGYTVFPGFIDPHMHFLDGVIYQGALDCTSQAAPTLAQLKNLLTEKARSTENGHWVVGHGYDTWKFPEKRCPTRYELDEAVPDHPVVITHFSFHECVANSRALELAGIDRNTPQPPAGEIVKDAKGEPTGELIETAMGLVRTKSRQSLIAHGKEKILADLSGTQSALFACGITRCGDAAVSSELETLYHEAFEQGALKIPVVKHFCSNEDMFQLPGDVVDTPRQPSHHELLIDGPLKIFLDGAERAGMVLSIGRLVQSLVVTLTRCIRSFSLAPFKTASHSPASLGKGLKVHLGTMMADTEACVKLASRAARQSMGLAFHAIGNEAVSQAIDIIARVRKEHCDCPPPRIEHALFLNDHMIEQIKALGIAIVTQPYFITHMGEETLPFIPGLKQLPLKSLMDAGIPVAGSSDWPVDTFDPLEGIQKAVTRIIKGRKILQKNEAISVQAAIRMYTSNAARVLGCQDDVGSLEPGKRADFILLSNDPLAENQAIAWESIRVQKTFLGGTEVFSR